MDRKLFFFDVDGTLIDDETKIAPRSAIEAIRRLRSAGQLVFINSGRTLCLLKYPMELFGISDAACGCGTQIVSGGKTLMEKRVERRRGAELRRLLGELKADVVLEGQDAICFSPRPFRCPEVMEMFWDYMCQHCETETGPLEQSSRTFDKFCIQLNPLHPEAELIRNFAEQAPDFTCIERGRGFYEFVPGECSKGRAITFVREYYGIAPENCYLFGDSANDLSMFQSEVGNRILMGSHDTVLEPYATLVTDKVMNDGIEKALRKLGVL